MDLFKPGVVFDYDIFKSLIFAGVTLSEIDFKLFRDIYYFMTKDLYKSNLVVYLLQKTEKLLSNINNRGREYEKDISKDYLDKINNAYINYLKNRSRFKYSIYRHIRFRFCRKSYRLFRTSK